MRPEEPDFLYSPGRTGRENYLARIHYILLNLIIPESGKRIFRIPGEQRVARVVKRENRFVCSVMLDDQLRIAHLHDPGRLMDLIYPGNSILVRESHGMKTDLSITAALRNKEWILTDSRFHNQIAAGFLQGEVQREVTLGKSRLDFKVGNAYVEVKGCSMLDGDVATFPDAPTARGKHHLELLTDLIHKGLETMLIVLVFSHDSRCFSPNFKTDPGFSMAFRNFLDEGGGVFIPKFRFLEPYLVFHGVINTCENAFG